MHSDVPLVPTKFAPPRIGARHIPRRHLLERLRASQQSALTLIIGSAGFGKTILLVQWRQELMKAGADVAWLALSQDDGRGPLFCHYLLAAFERLRIVVEDNPLADGTSDSRAIENVVAEIVAGAQRIGKDIYLFIDDYHQVDDPLAHRLLQKLLNHCPANLHIVMSSRVAPLLTLGRLRVCGQVTDLGSADLAFSLEESQAFFEQNLSTIKLTADELQLIQDMTQGWPASLQLIAIMLRSRPAAREQLHTFLWRSSDLQAYLAEDVIAHSPPTLIGFLESMSVFRRFNAELAVDVTANRGAPDLLRQAEDENLLIHRVDSDDRSPWYTFHPLLGEFLSGRLAQRGTQAVEALHRRGSHWYASHDMLAEAVRHANLGGDSDFAVDAIEQAVPANWSLAYISPMLHLLDRMPPGALSARPRIFFLGCLIYALTARPCVAQRWLDEIRRCGAANDPAIADKLPLAEAAIATQRDDSQRVIELLEGIPHGWPEIRLLNYVYLAALANGYAGAGRIDDAIRLLNENPVVHTASDNEIALVVEGMMPLARLVQGNVRDAARRGKEVLARSEAAYGRHALCSNLSAAMLGSAYYELDRVDEAREILANRSGILRASSPEVMIRASLSHARLDCLRQDPAAAIAFLDSQAAHFHSLNLDRPMAYMLAEQARMLFADGDHVRAEGVVAKLNALADAHRHASGYRAEIPAIAALARARLALMNCNPAESLVALDQVRDFAQRYGRRRILALADLIAAASLASMEQHERARPHLIAAVEAGAELGFVRTFLDEGERMVPLLSTLRQEPALGAVTTQYLSGLLEKLGSRETAPARTAPAGAGPQGAPGVGLTPREREILLLISQAMSNKRIALTLNITVGTTKWNVRNILTKLGVSTRYDAMIWARQHGFIE
jgi:LuxR family maltose regulon positive regulatory protein